MAYLEFKDMERFYDTSKETNDHHQLNSQMLKV